MTDGALEVALHGRPLGTLGRTPGGALLSWSPEAVRDFGLNSAILSRSLLVGIESVDLTESFFGALLPEGMHLERLARECQVASNDLVGLLGRVGADLAGALTVGDSRVATDPQPIDRAGVAELLRTASGYLVGGGGSALPGFQRKVTLTFQDGTWIRGNGTLPSTHIVKPVADDLRQAVEAENYVLGIGRKLGLLEFDTWIETFDDSVALVVERYDRTRGDHGVERLHQEDLGQALGLPWGGDAKFESQDPRASLRSVASVLDSRRSAFSPGRPEAEQLLRYTTLSVAAGNTDAHAKNFSLLHDARGRTSLAPYYDAAPLALQYDATQTLSMRINGVSQLPEVTRDDLTAEAGSWGVDAGRARSIVDETLDGIVQATRQLPVHESIARHVPGYVRQQAENLAAGRRARIASPIPLMARTHIGTQPPASV